MIKKNILEIILLTITAIIIGALSINMKVSISLIAVTMSGIVSIMFLNTNKRYIFMVVALIILNENLLHISSRNISSIVAIIGLIIFIFRINIIINKKYIFKNIVLYLLLICFISQIGAYFRFGQPITLGILGMHFIFIYLYYFHFVDLIESKIGDKGINHIIDIIINLGTIMSILYLIQAFIYPKVIIFNMSYSYRNGSVRFFTGYVMIMFSIIMIYSKLLEKFSKKYFIYMSIQIISLIIVSQTRNFILGVFIAIAIGFIISKKINKIRLCMIVSMLSIIYMLFFKDNYLSQMINEIILEFKTGTGTIGARMSEFKFYMNLLKDSLLIGVGLLDSRFSLTPIITGYDPYFYFIGDLGLIGIVIQCGILGGIWMVCFFRNIYIYGKKSIYLNSDNLYIMTLTLALLIGVFASGLIFDKGSILYICLFLSISEVSYKAKLNKN